ncbi:MAG: hypothetical protein AYK19_17380 [Theionarchaea archaeon DG-70-1]|nr:MAG: hypothetical protein AYK19_17380 [Theionarchaea archaeon DG-70-1]
MNEEEWQFLIVMVGAGVLAAAVAINDLFSLQKFWARLIRSKRPPTPETITKAYTRHQRFYHHTDRSLFSTTYVSFYLFVLSYIGMLLMAALILIQDTLQGTSYNADARLAPLSAILLFFLISRWYYRQEAQHVTAHKLFAILSSFLFIDFVYRITGLEYIQVASVLLILWIWMIGVVRAVVGFEVNYVRTITLSFCIPLAILIFLTTSNGIIIFALFVPGIVVTLKEFISKSELEFKKMKRIFPNPLPFIPIQPDSFLKDIVYSSHPEKIFAGCSVWEVLFWFSMTPVVLIPIAQYLQGREEQLQQWHDDLTQWSQNEYVLTPETVADKLGKTLEDTYPLLNELTEEGKLTLYESPKGLLYGLPPSEEMEAFITRLNLRKADLPEKDRDLLEYLWEKGRTRLPTTVLLSVIDNAQRIEVSCEPAGGTISPLKVSVFTDTGVHFAQISQDINYYVGETVQMLAHLNQYTLIHPDKFLSSLEKKGKDLLQCAVPHEIREGLEMSHMVLETNIDDTPFELMYSYAFFALKYAIGRRLRVTGSVPVKRRKDVGKLRALIIADPQCDLKEALTECDYLEAELAHLLETYYLPQEKATWEEVLTCLAQGYSIIHYAGHASEEGLHLSDRVLEPSDIETLLWGNPIVFINGCNSAKTHTRLAEAFLRGGALGYIGSVWEIHDVAAAELATDFYTNSFQYSVGEALRMAKAAAFYKNNVSWLCFILFGDPTLRLI